MKADIKLKSLILSHKIQIFFLLLLIILIVLLWGYRELYFNNGESAEKILQDLWLESIFSIFTILVTGFFFDIYLKNTNDDIDKRRILEAIQSDDNILKMFSNQQRELFIEKNINSIIGNRYGDYLFHKVLKAYLDINLIYREEYHYDVEIMELKNGFSTNDFKINCNDYFCLNQTLISSKHFSVSRKDINFKIIFAFNELSLDNWLNDEAVFMREILWVTDSDNILSKFTKEELNTLVLKNLNLKLNFFDLKDNEFEESEYNIEIVNEKLVQGLQISLTNKTLSKYIYTKENSIYYKAKVSFTIPFNKSINRFYFVVAEPTVSPKFTIRFNNEIKNIDFLTYFAQRDDAFKISKDLHMNKYTIASKEIVYPRSGVIFFWKI